MIKALIISYHFLPMNAVASYRTKAYADYFIDHGIYPTVLTHFWNAATDDHLEDKQSNRFDIIRIPTTENYVTKLHTFFAKIPILSVLITLLYNALGLFELHTLHSYYAMKKYLLMHLNSHKYDIIVSVFSPSYQVRLPYEIYRKTGIPYVIDFRDLWDNRVVSPSYHPSAKERIRDSLVKFYWRKWLSKASFFTITSSKWREYISSFVTTGGFVLPNGYEKELFGQIPEQSHTSSYFEILFFGSLYPNQDLKPFFEGVRNFVDTVKPIKFCVHFLGLNTLRRPGVIDELKRNIDPGYLKISPKVDKAMLPEYINNASLLFYPAFNSIPGWVSAKVYDYIASRKNILVCPGDNGLVEKLVEETNSGYVAHTAEAVTKYISSQYEHWTKYGYLGWCGKIEEVEKHSREVMAQRMAELIKDNLKLHS